MEVSEGEYGDGAGAWLLSCGHPISECVLDGELTAKENESAQCGGKTRWLLLKKEINILLCKISNIYFSQKENSIISPRFTVYLLNDHGQIILAL